MLIPENKNIVESEEINPVIETVIAERDQGHSTRVGLIEKLEEIYDKPILSFFTSFKHPVSIEDEDADMIAGMLQMMDLTKGLILIVSSPGGNGLAAERIINICRTYSKTGEYSVIIPGKAKSAATMICFGANKIFLGPTSELGPVDPQVAVNHNGSYKYLPAHSIVNTYHELFEKAIKEKGNLEPYMQQLAKYDAAEVKDFENAIELATNISIKALQSGMMSSKNEEEILNSLSVFLDPNETQTHGRPIFFDIAKDCDLNVEKIEANSEEWHYIYELYIRTHNYVTNVVSKAIETKDHAFLTPIPRR